MIVKELELTAFRNYDTMRAEFSPGINVIYGENAQGKTNLLEAVSYLSNLKSHRARYDRELISFSAQAARIYAGLYAGGRDRTVEVRLFRGARRQLFSGGVKLKTGGELTGTLSSVLFCPEDLQLIKDGPAARRRFLDQSISQLRPRYAAALAEYNRLYDHKTRILKDWEAKPALLDTLDEFNLRMAQTGAILIHYRAHYIRKLREKAGAVHREFSGGREELGLAYETVKTIADPLAPPSELLKALLEHQRTHRQAELSSRLCLSGPHKDDISVTLNGVDTRTYGSQGQARTAALSFKLAEREISRDDRGEYPVLLLDDVLSELDPRRQEFVLNRIQGGQVFITCCEDDRLAELKDGRVFHVKNGTVSSQG